MKFEGNLKDLTKKSGIYKITCFNNKKVYIGSSCNLRSRLAEHKRKLISGKHHSKYLQRTWNKYNPDSFSFEVVEYCGNDQILKREQYWIDFFKSFNPELGFNTCPAAGSPIGVKRTPEQIEANRQRNLGRKLSPEALKNIQETNRINKNKKFEISSPDGQIFRGIGIHGFALEHGLNPCSLSGVLTGRYLNHKGWVKPENFGKKVKVVCKQESQLMSPEGRIYIVKAGFLPQFCRENNLCWSNIYLVISDKMRHHRGWTRADKPDYHVHLIHEDKKIETICRFHLKPFIEKYNLSRGSVSAIINKKRPQHKGWKLKQL